MQIVFVHGAFVRDGAWWWRAVGDLLQQTTGIRSRAVGLPSCGEASSRLQDDAGLLADAAALAGVLDEGEASVVVAHSYGGTVVAQGAHHPAVRHLVYISSFLPEIGETQASVTATSAPLPVTPHPDGTVSVDDEDRETFDRRFFQDVEDRGTVEQAHTRLCPQSVAAFGTPTTRAAWQHLPSTYLLCADDRSTSPDLQRVHAARATTVEELPTGHHPFLSQPDLVAAQLRTILQRYAG